ncbi:MAG TPA: hypothetical protein VGZ32_14585 [Actinocrinis sp.]|jgi:hypothetical protein|uniref:hypothetical protein n=1 Tax=Actinocrinis sp. TaxID=1920516 RepID=UPI002DDD7026|nr:hypothetical protein [Actinocrinis sp.]HEV3171574.1 hypothetical protein [Actinocrinis sp.]
MTAQGTILLGEDTTLRGLVHSIDLRALAFWATPAALHIEDELGPVDPAKSLEGRWGLVIGIVGGVGPTDEAVADFYFRPDHTIKALGPEADDGDPHFIGIGYWFSFPDGSFVFGVNHPGLPDGAGGSSGAIFGMHRGEVVGDTLTTRGFAVVDQGAGQPYVGPLRVAARGTRTVE